jgi:predicted ATP-grasp superfamily ATP-dependent carboligase
MRAGPARRTKRTRKGPGNGRPATRKGREIELDGLGKLTLPAKLKSPALIAAFEGWNDAGEAASGAVNHLGIAWQASPIGAIDPEDFYDFQATRPRVKMVDGQAREIVWPAVELFEARVPRAPRDLILMAGSEPSFRWRTFCQLVTELAEVLNTQLVVTLGALLADVPHTRPVSVTGLSSDPALVSRLGLAPSSYEGPTGIVGILHAACQQAGLPSASLWAAVPHYIAATPNPKAALALVRKLEGLVGVAVDGSDLEHASSDYDRQVNVAVQSDPDVQAFVERLEQAASEEAGDSSGPLPSGETIARDLQRFLRQRGDEESGPGGV